MRYQVNLNNADKTLSCIHDDDCYSFEELSRRLRFDYFQFSIGPEGLWWNEGVGPTNPDQTVVSDINEHNPSVSIVEVIFADVTTGLIFTEITDGSGRVIGLQLPITYIGIDAGGPNFSWEDNRLNIEVAASANLLITGYGIGSIYDPGTGDEKRLLFVGSHQAICLMSGDRASCNYNFIYLYSV